MTQDNGAAATADTIPPERSVTVLSPQVIEAYEAMIADVPDAGGEGMDAILQALATATDIRDLDAPWRSGNLESFLNTPIVVTGIRKLPSDYDGGLPYFLVVDAGVRASGELVTITTGAVSVVAQLVKAHGLDAFPLTVVPRRADRPSRSGFYPLHLEVVR